MRAGRLVIMPSAGDRETVEPDKTLDKESVANFVSSR